MRTSGRHRLLSSAAMEMTCYRAPWWLPTGHMQTLYAALLRPCAPLSYRRERWITDDGDFLDLDWCGETPHAPLLVLFHGLEGSSRSHYAVSLMNAAIARGWRGVVIHFRGCGGELNRLPRAYFAGDGAEVGWVLRRLRDRFRCDALFVVGVSLGGNALLKWLGETGAEVRTVIEAAAAVSAPLDLHAAGRVLDRGFNRQVYVRHFLRTLKPKAYAKLERYPGLFDRVCMAQAATLRAFDDIYTAPLHGFKDAEDYWEKASSKPVLKDIAVPTLLINARNDPFLPADALPGVSDVSPSVTLEYPENGGHAGFVSGPFPGNLDWLPRRVLGHCRRVTTAVP
ncbi:MAG: YheT family hydrolase [Burkholderiales bacterium]